MGYRIAALLLTMLLLTTPLAMGSVSAASANESGGGTPFLEGATQFESVGDTGVSTATADEDHLTQTKTFIAKPDDSGTVRLEMDFSIPDQVVELTTAIPQNATVTGTDGFAPTGDGNYSWDEETAGPSITLSYSVNRSGRYHQRPVADHSSEGLLFADTDDWTIASVPSNNVWWKSLGSEPRVSIVRKTTVEGAGIAGDRMVFLGDYTSHSEIIDGQTMALVVPEAASLTPAPAAVFDSMDAAATSLPDAHVERSLVIAAPTAVNWGPNGLADGSDTWVRADQKLDTPANVWLHEFVHLRQDFRTNEETRWIVEGMPEYYAALFTLKSGAIDFETFADHLKRGSLSRYDDTVLSTRETWATRGNYAKGALVYGTLDRQIRHVSDQSAATLQLFQAMNEYDGPIDQQFLEEEIASLANVETADDFTRFSTTTETPQMWSASVHEDAFGTAPANLATAINDSIMITGQYRNRTVTSIPPLVTGETLTVPVTITNEGEATGSYELELQFDGQTVATESGSLEGGIETTVEMSHTVNETGTSTLTVDGHSWPVTVSEPANLEVTTLETSQERVQIGETATVTMVIENSQSIPANGTIEVRRSKTQVTNLSVQLDVNETVERTVEVTILEVGPNRVTAGDKTITIDGLSSETTGTPTPDKTSNLQGTTETRTPGFTVVSFVFASILLSGVLRRRIG